VGKTTTAVTALTTLINKQQVSGRFVSADTYIEMLKDQFGGSDNLLPEMYSTPYLVKYIQGVFDVVIVDGLGQERETEFAIHEIGSLLRRRFDDMRSTVITTTLSPMNLIRRYGERVSGVVNAMTVVRVA
jgi:DNA replication protein DnaC